MIIEINKFKLQYGQIKMYIYIYILKTLKIMNTSGSI